MVGFRTTHTSFFLFSFLRHGLILVGEFAPSGSITRIRGAVGTCF